MLKFKNYEIDALTKFLFEMKLSGKKSRMRTRMVKQLDQYYKDVILKERDTLIKEYAMKDEHGEVLLNDDKTQVLLVKETIPEFNNELNELMNEEYIIGLSENNREMMIIVANIVLDCDDVDFSGNEAIMYDEWCEKFEDLLGQYENKDEHQI